MTARDSKRVDSQSGSYEHATISLCEGSRARTKCHYLVKK
ncbi:hypothetical protein C4K40_0700 [Pseudomonas sp. CMR5c]|nr:hypothetical protein C4K40_0700 [Pseudomonas sp. CMR5c]